MGQDPRGACRWGLCPLGEEAPGLTVLSPSSWAGALPLPWAQRLWLRAASLLRFLAHEQPQDGHRGPHLGSRPRTGSGPDAAHSVTPLIALLCCTQPCPLSVPLGCSPLVPISKGDLLFMLQDVVLVSPLPGSLSRLCPPYAAPPTPCGGWGGLWGFL